MVAERNLQEPQDCCRRLRQAGRRALLGGLQCCVCIGACLTLVSGVCRDRRGDRVGDGVHLIAAELLRPFHGVLGDLSGGSEAPTPDFDQRAVG